MADPARPARSESAFLLTRGSIYTLTTALQLSASFLILPVLTRLLSEEQYGEVATALVVLQVLTFVASLGLPYALTIEYFQGADGLRSARALVALTAIAASVVALLAAVTGPFWAEWLFGDLGFTVPMLLACIASVPMAVMISAQALLRSLDEARGFVTVTLLGTAGAQVLGVLFVFLGSATATSYQTGLLAGLLLAATAGMFACGVDLSGLVGRTGREVTASALRLGIPTVPHTVAIFLIAGIDRVLVERYEGLDGVARYQVAYLIGALGITLVGAVNNAWSPLVFGADEARRRPVLETTTAMLYRLVGLVIGGLALAAPIALAIAAPPSYGRADLAPVVALVALSALPYVSYISNSHVIFYERRAWWLSWMTPCAAIVNVVANVCLIPRIGLEGAAIATVVAYFVLAGLATVGRRRLLALRIDRRALVEGWGVGVGVVALAVALPTTGGWLVVRMLGAAGLFVAFAMSVRGVVAGGVEVSGGERDP